MTQEHVPPRTEEQRNNDSTPPPSNAGYLEEVHPRNEAEKALKEAKRAEWKINLIFLFHNSRMRE
ncbi:hypothetical protein [Candidatus Enterovibrio escicola]|nr:hypothetical protein [Candidatus Enterovibrio escacola]